MWTKNTKTKPGTGGRELHTTKELVWAKRVMERPTPTSKANTECIKALNKLSIWTWFDSIGTTGGFEG